MAPLAHVHDRSECYLQQADANEKDGQEESRQRPHYRLELVSGVKFSGRKIPSVRRLLNVRIRKAC